MATSPPLRAGVYARQSHGKETSVDDQIAAGTKRCAVLGADVALTYRDRVSASRFGTGAREDWPRLVDDVVTDRIDLVWMWDSSRGDRTPESWFRFLSVCRERGVLIHVERDQRTYDVRIPRDWKTLGESGVDAGYDSEIRSVDVRRGIAGAAELGKPHGVVPFGLDRIYDATDRKVFTQRPNEDAPMVKEIIERVAKRDPIVAIVRDFAARGLVGPSGKPWTRNNVRQAAENPSYAGLRSHKGVLHQANWPGIVDRTTFESAQQVLSEPGRKRSAPGALKWLLSYIITTPCGSVVHAVPLKAQADRYRCDADGCVSIGVAEADEYVTRLVFARLARPNARKVFANNDSVSAEAQADIVMIRTEARELEAEARAGRVRAALAAALDASIQDRLRAALARAGVAGGNAAALALLGEGEFTEEVAWPRWEALGVAARRSVIVDLIERMELRRTTVRLTKWSSALDRLELAAERIVVTKWIESV
jgi:DNA invertase Pin-like site-specific DNA recombinase